MPTIGPPALRGGKAAKRMRYLAVAATTGILLAAGLPGGTAEAAKAKTWVVKPGQSIQKVVNRARSGDTIKIKAGTFAEAVCVVGKGPDDQGGRGHQDHPGSPEDSDEDQMLDAGCP